MLVGWKSINAVLACMMVLFSFGVFLLILLRGLGGNEAVFAILGYIAGWISSVVMFFYRRSPQK